jgi:hypothetical protein
MTPEDFGLCVHPNAEFLEENCVWVVTLSDGTKLYQQDGGDVPEFLMELEHNHSSWVRLGAFMEQSDLDIVAWNLQFRDNKVPLKTAEIGYVYSRGMIGSMSVGTENAKRTTQHFHITGTIDSSMQRMVDRAWYHSPSLVHGETKVTALVDLDPSMIILRKGVDKPSF